MQGLLSANKPSSNYPAWTSITTEILVESNPAPPSLNCTLRPSHTVTHLRCQITASWPITSGTNASFSSGVGGGGKVKQFSKRNKLTITGFCQKQKLRFKAEMNSFKQWKINIFIKFRTLPRCVTWNGITGECSGVLSSEAGRLAFHSFAEARYFAH